MYAKMLMHYGVLALPCRPYAPNLKGKVESAVGHTQDTGLAGRRFESIEQQNEHLMHWNERWAATRIHGTTKRQVQAMFEEERPHLIALPGNRFEYYRIFERVVHSDGHVEVHGAYYSVPPRYVGCRVIVHVGQLWLRIIDRQTHQCQREHSLIQRGRRRTDIADRPRQTPPSVDALLERAARISPSCGAFSKAMHKYDPDKSERRLFGLFDLARRYKPEDLERACALGLVCENYRLRFLRKYLSTHAQSAKLTQEHQAIASVQTYAAHFSHNA
jgi:putative transposon-encoded protein